MTRCAISHSVGFIRSVCCLVRRVVAMWLYLALHTQVHASYNLSNYFNLVTLLWCYPTILFLNPWTNKVIPGKKTPQSQ